MIIGGYGSGKKNELLNLISQQDDVDEINLYVKDLSEPKYEFLIEKHKNVGLKYLNHSKAFIECSNTINHVYDYNPTRKRKILIVFDSMIADIKFQAGVKELFIRCRKLNISLVFITQSYFSLPKEVRLNSARYLIMKIHNKKELLSIGINHSADIDYKDFMKIHRKCLSEPYSFLTIDTVLTACDSLRFRKNILNAMLLTPLWSDSSWSN